MDLHLSLGEPSGRRLRVLHAALAVGYGYLSAVCVRFAVPWSVAVVGGVIATAAIAATRWRTGVGLALGLLLLWCAVRAPILGSVALVPVGYALYRIGGRSRLRVGLAALVAASVTAVAAREVAIGGGAIGPFVWLFPAWIVALAAGRAIGAERRRAEAVVRSHAESAETERERARRAAVEERVRIARELHDVVAHGMSVITVQAAFGHLIVEQRPAEARAALATIESTGRETLAEMRRLLTVLRDDDPLALAPSATLADLDQVVEDARRAGVRVDLAVEGDPGGIPAGIQLAAYRIVQEALTNVVRHARTDAARVSIARDAGELVVVVVDAGAGGPVGARGHGLVGMRERVELYGGSVEAGPLPGHGFRVTARIPVPDGAVTEVVA